MFVSKHKEDEIRKEDAHENFIHAFNAYAPSGDVNNASLVYVNYGRYLYYKATLVVMQVVFVLIASRNCKNWCQSTY